MVTSASPTAKEGTATALLRAMSCGVAGAAGVAAEPTGAADGADIVSSLGARPTLGRAAGEGESRRWFRCTARKKDC
jgi:hypothetical protein